MAHTEEGSAAEKLTYLLVGAGIGAVLALLFAPKAGKELREDIADATKRGLEASREGARRVGETASDLYDTGRTRAGELYETGRNRAGELYDQGREKATGAYSAAREKVAQGADAVSDVAAKQKDQIAAAIEAGKQAYHEEKRKAEQSRAAVEGESA